MLVAPKAPEIPAVFWLYDNGNYALDTTNTDLLLRFFEVDYINFVSLYGAYQNKIEKVLNISL